MAERAHPDLPGFKDKWFGLKKSVYKQRLFDRYRFCNRFVKGKIVLEIPCGVGWGTSLLKGARKIHAVDISEEAVEYAKKNFNRPNVVYQTGDMSAIPFENAHFDLIICLEGFEHVRKEIALKFLEESRRVLKPEGLLIMTVPILTNGRHSGNPYHLFEPSLEELQDILAARFKLRHFEVFQGPDSEIVKFVGIFK
jgi:ubiquinone/menaquinone biosynthesis C-methylase UbiE